MFKGILLTQNGRDTVARHTDIDEQQLPPGDVDVDIEWSTLNYKDGLAITGQGPIVRSWPMVPGIDFAGTVRDSRHPDWAAGARVVLTGWGLGETRWGGLAQRARVEAGWLLALPAGIDTRSLEDSLQVQLALRAEREATLLAARAELDAHGAAVHEHDRARLSAEQALGPLRERLQDLRLKEQEARIHFDRAVESLQERNADHTAVAALLEARGRSTGLAQEIANQTSQAF